MQLLLKYLYWELLFMKKKKKESQEIFDFENKSKKKNNKNNIDTIDYNINSKCKPVFMLKTAHNQQMYL